ncbi:MAG: DUF721 domain-containing protein [Candidatus Limnocylindrales bacterium]
MSGGNNRSSEPSGSRRRHLSVKGGVPSEVAADRPGDEDPARDRREGVPGRMERVADLLPRIAREHGLEEQLDQARAAVAWDRIVADRVPAAVGACRLVDLRQDVATIEIDMPIVAQEIRLRTPELLAALREAVSTPVRQLRLTTRHV